MASVMKDTVDNVVSKLMEMQQFSAVLDYEPKAPPTGYTAAVWLQSVTPVGDASGLAKVSMIYALRIRLYRDMLEEPADDKRMLERIDNLFDDLFGDFDLGATVRAIDIFGTYGQSVSVTTGYVDVGGVMYRIGDFELPLIVDDVATLTK
jgi:hypothetical protein